jgi:hypothetical protein
MREGLVELGEPILLLLLLLNLVAVLVGLAVGQVAPSRGVEVDRRDAMHGRLPIPTVMLIQEPVPVHDVDQVEDPSEPACPAGAPRRTPGPMRRNGFGQAVS